MGSCFFYRRPPFLSACLSQAESACPDPSGGWQVAELYPEPNAELVEALSHSHPRSLSHSLSPSLPLTLSPIQGKVLNKLAW